MNEPTTLLKQYEETGKLLNTFLDWRHKVMTRFFIALSAIFISIQWMYTNEVLKKFIFLPLLIGAIFSLVIACMDMVNQRILNTCYELGREIEEKLFSSPGLYQKMHSDFINNRIRRIISYRRVLKILYLGSAVVLFLSSIFTFLFRFSL